MTYETDYKFLVRRALECPTRQTRNHPTKAMFGHTLKMDCMEFGIFPILNCRRMYPKGIVGELASFLQGATTIAEFKANGCNYWDKWADKDGNLNLDYGTTWLNINGVNQLETVVNSLIDFPTSRRHLIVGYRPDKVAGLSLPSCHYAYQWFVQDNLLHMIWVQRSVDLMIGLPADMVLAGLFNALMAQSVGLEPGTITMQLGDCHIYEDHIPGAQEYVNRGSEPFIDVIPPTWTLDPDASVFNFEPELFSIPDYAPMEPITFELHK